MSTITETSTPLGRPPDDAPIGADKAYDLVRSDAAALPAGEVGRVTGHVPTVASTALGAWPNIEAYLGDIAKLHGFDLDALLKLRLYALALVHAHLLTLPMSEAETRLKALLGEAAPLREALLTAAEGLALLGFVDAERVAAIRGGSGHLDTANDLIALAQLFRAGGDELLGKTRVAGSEVERAYELGMQIVEAVGRRRVGTDDEGAASEYEDACARLFRLVVRTYDQGRRALTYLRWSEGDVNELMPSLFVVRRRSRGSSPEAPDGEDPVEPTDAG
jgi:hypothetical protein